MIRCICFVQEGQTPERKTEELERKLSSFSEQAFGAAANVNWVSVSAGNGFTAAQPSTSSIVSMTAEEPIPQEKRVSLLKELCDIWIDETGCSLDEVVAIINDPQPA